MSRSHNAPDVGRLPERPVHQSLVRIPRYAGVDRSFLVLEVTLVLCLVYLLGVSVASVLVVIGVVAGVHPLMVRLSDVDELLPAVSRAHAQAVGRVRAAPWGRHVASQAQSVHSRRLVT